MILLPTTSDMGAKTSGPTPKPTTKREMERKMTSFETPRVSAGPLRLRVGRKKGSLVVNLALCPLCGRSAYSPVGRDEPMATDKQSRLVEIVTSHFFDLGQSLGFSPSSNSTMIAFSAS